MYILKCIGAVYLPREQRIVSHVKTQLGLPVPELPRKNKMVEPSTTRTNRDGIMIVLGVVLIVFFVVAGYLTLTRSDSQPNNNKTRGPVKDPSRSSSFFNAPKCHGNLITRPRFLCQFLEPCLPATPPYSVYLGSLCRRSGRIFPPFLQQHAPVLIQRSIRRAYRDFHAVT